MCSTYSNSTLQEIQMYVAACRQQNPRIILRDEEKAQNIVQ